MRILALKCLAPWFNKTNKILLNNKERHIFGSVWQELQQSAQLAMAATGNRATAAAGPTSEQILAVENGLKQVQPHLRADTCPS
jgi:hypothetical protein